MLPLILNTNLIKRKSKIRYPYDTIWDRLNWEPAVIVVCSSTNWKSLQYASIKFWNDPGKISLPWNCASILKSRIHQPEQYQSLIKQNPTTISLIIYKYYTHAKLRSSYWRCSVKQGVLRNFAKFTGKHLYHLVIPLSSITFTANSHADNHFYKYIYLLQILYSMKLNFY